MEQELLILLPDQSLTFSSADHFKYKVLKYVVQNTPTVIVIDGRYIRTIDATVAKVKLKWKTATQFESLNPIHFNHLFFSTMV